MKEREPVTLLRKGDVALMLQASVRTVERLIAAGDLAVVKVRAGVRVPYASVRAYIRRNLRGTEETCPVV